MVQTDGKKNLSPTDIGKGVFWNPRFSRNCRDIDPGAGKHPSPLEVKKKKKKKKNTHTQTNSPHQNITESFYRIKKYCSYQKLWRFFCDFLPAPIDRKFDVRDNPGAGKHPSPLGKKKKKKKKKKKSPYTHTNK